MRIYPLLLTVFIDSLGFGLVLPLLSPLIMNQESGFLAFDTSIATRGWTFGLLAAIYCIGQFFSSPVLGTISDKKGRKKVLLGTLWMAAIGYTLGAISLHFHSLTGLFFSRLLVGIAAGNFAIAQSYIADVTPNEGKSKNFGLLGMSWGLGFILGPFLGGKLSDPSVVSWFSFATPFWVSSLICVINLLLVTKKLVESRVVDVTKKIHWFAGITDVKKAFQHPVLRNLFIVMFIFCFGWGFFTEFSPLFLIRVLHLSVGEIANFYAYVGVCIALCQGLLIRPFIKKFSPTTLLPVALFALGLMLIAIMFVSSYGQMFAVLPFVAFPEALIFPSAATLISNVTSKDTQGEILGIYNSVQWAGIGFSPLFSGPIVAQFPYLPMMVASGCMFLGFSLLIWFAIKKKREALSNLVS